MDDPKKPLSREVVAKMVNDRDLGRLTVPILQMRLKSLAESHERLRLELEGAEKMIEAFGEKFCGVSPK